MAVPGNTTPSRPWRTSRWIELSFLLQLMSASACNFIGLHPSWEEFERALDTVQYFGGDIFCPFTIKGSRCPGASYPGYSFHSPYFFLSCASFQGQSGDACEIDCPGVHFVVEQFAILELHSFVFRNADSHSVIVKPFGYLDGARNLWEDNGSIITTDRGGAIMVEQHAEVVLTLSTFRRNRAAQGGAVYNRGTVTFDVGGDALFERNVAREGGAIYNANSMQIYDSSFYENTGLVGGGIFNEGQLSVSNSRFVFNTVGFASGGFGEDGLVSQGPAIAGTSGSVTLFANTGCGNRMIHFNRACDGVENVAGICESFGDECTFAPTRSPVSSSPTVVPTKAPVSADPSSVPSISPSISPSGKPSLRPSRVPSFTPSRLPSNVPSTVPSHKPSNVPSFRPSMGPSPPPSEVASDMPSSSIAPSGEPSQFPSGKPSVSPSTTPSKAPTMVPTTTQHPSLRPTPYPTAEPSWNPSVAPSGEPSVSEMPSVSAFPSQSPSSSTRPSEYPSQSPSTHPPSATPITLAPTAVPSLSPSQVPSTPPSETPSVSSMPSLDPSELPPRAPTASPTRRLYRTGYPSVSPSLRPSSLPSEVPSGSNSPSVSQMPSTQTELPTTGNPSHVPTSSPPLISAADEDLNSTQKHVEFPSVLPSLRPSISKLPSAAPVVMTNNNSQRNEAAGRKPSLSPSSIASDSFGKGPPPSISVARPHDDSSMTAPTVGPTNHPSPEPTVQPTVGPTFQYSMYSPSLVGPNIMITSGPFSHEIGSKPTTGPTTGPTTSNSNEEMPPVHHPPVQISSMPTAADDGAFSSPEAPPSAPPSQNVALPLSIDRKDNDDNAPSKKSGKKSKKQT